MTACLEDLAPGLLVHGLLSGEPVTVVAVQWHGTSCVTLTYTDADGSVGHRLVYRGDEDRLTVVEGQDGRKFDGDGEVFRLVAEASRIRLAHLFDPRLAVHLSLLEPLPHQIQAVYGELLPRQPLRFALCDDPGAGKTIMAGLYIKELRLRGALSRCLIVVPGGLVTQWQDELADRFGLDFTILTRDLIEATRTADPFLEHDLLLARLDHLSRNDELLDRLARSEWDLVVVDEAHRMSARFFGNELKETRRYRLGKVLGLVARHLLLMTATPHAGKEEDFHLFLALLDPDRFEGRPRGTARLSPSRPLDVSDLMRRMVKERLLRFDGRPLFPERRATTVTYPLSPDEASLYEQVTDYVRSEMNRADRLSAAGDGRRGNRVGFAVTVLQRRLASSPEAIYQSLRRRRRRLEERLDEECSRGRADAVLVDTGPDVDVDDLEEEEAAARESIEEQLVDDVTSAHTRAELAAEIATLARLEALAERVRRSGSDRKWIELLALVERPELVDRATGTRRKLIVFTEHRDTLNFLVERLRSFLGRTEAVVAIHGGVHRQERRRIQEVFTQDPGCVVLVATDAAGEGINLQRASLLVNYDLPWNPNRIEQRFGRVHRIGQTQVCHLWNLVADGTREGLVYRRLLDKLEEQRRALGGQVFDVLGDALPGRALRDLLIEAIRYGDQPEVRARLEAVVDERVGEGLVELVAEHALAADVLAAADVERIRRDLLEAEARRLQPHYVRAWFADAFSRLGGRITEREPDRFEITRVPDVVRRRGHSGGGRPVLPCYERVTFDKSLVRHEGRAPAELVAPGHPLLDAVVTVTLERHGDLLHQGAVLVDEADLGHSVRLLVFLDHSVTDGHEAPGGGPRVVSRRYEYADIRDDGTVTAARYAPYLDTRPLLADERSLIEPLLNEPWLAGDVERLALDHAIEHAVPTHLAEVRERTESRVRKVRAAVQERLAREIAYWDARAAELREQADTGRQPRMNPDRAEARANELAVRLQARMAQLDRDQQLAALPPVVAGMALVMPAGLLSRLRGETAAAHALERDEVERRAVDAVLAAEERLGRQAREQLRNNPGFDIRSHARDGGTLFLEVKGRIAGADSFVVTRNEILHALNVPDAWVLALVEVSPQGAARDRVRYLRQPFGNTVHLPFATTATTLDWQDYWQRGVEPS